MIDEMLDRLIAEYVMGGQLLEIPEPSIHWPGKFWQWPDGSYESPDVAWNPTRNIRQAWQVAQRIIERNRMEGLPTGLELFWSERERVWTCGYEAFAHTTADTAERAICLAAAKVFDL